MNTSGDAAEQVVRLSLEGFEVAAKLTGSAAKNIAILLMAALKEEGKTQGKTRLTNMIRSGKELKVFSIPQRDLKKFTEHAKKYGVLYTVLRDKYSKDPDVPIDIIARAEDASKIQRIVDRFEIGKVDKAQIVADAQKDVAERKDKEKDRQEKTMGEMVVEEAIGKAMQKNEQSHENPSAAETDKNPPSRQYSENKDIRTDKGLTAKQLDDKPSVKEKLERYMAKARADKEAERTELAKEEKSKPSKKISETRHKQPKKKKNSKER